MNCKPGDIAICIKGNHAGRIGTVIAPFTGGTCGGVRFNEVPKRHGHIWIFEVAGHFQVGRARFKQGPFPDAWLRPVSGLPEPGNAELLTLHIEGIA